MSTPVPADRKDPASRAFVLGLLICFTPDGREPSVTADGRCDLATCQELK
ncbi:MAG TPA: hypothetical protein VLL75_00960 [Vicinamibacteria bacterium]|nr:hypothetical protein [Vicinamibacteria bacterium]